MPGLSFLLKKKFHPARFDNQERLFVAEQNQALQNEREEQSAKEVLKEKEMLSYEAMGAMDVRDPRSSALKFMYSVPQSADETEGKKAPKGMASLQDYEAKIDHTGDDDMVRAFKAKLIQSKLKSLADMSQLAPENDISGPTMMDAPDTEISRDGTKSTKPNSQAHQSALEREVGGRRIKAALTHEQQGERFACLRNAPMEGGYAKGIAVKHQPFNELVRNVQCARCGEWGHRSGDRECPLKDYNPLDYARQQREDPMRRTIGETTTHVRPASSTTSSTASTTAAALASSSFKAMRRSTAFVDENGDSDPEAEFLASLTRREKMLLLKKLQQIEDGGVAKQDSSSSSSSSDSSSSDSDSSSSSSSSDSSDSESRRRKRKRSHKHKHKHKRSSASGGSSSHKRSGKSDSRNKEKQKKHKKDHN